MKPLQNCIGPSIRIGQEILCHPYSGIHKLGPLGRVGLVVAMCVCLSVPFSCNFFAWSDWCRACLVRGLVRSRSRSQSQSRVEP